MILRPFTTCLQGKRAMQSYSTAFLKTTMTVSLETVKISSGNVDSEHGWHLNGFIERNKSLFNFNSTHFTKQIVIIKGSLIQS